MVSGGFSELMYMGIEECDRGNTLKALSYFEEASLTKRTPLLNSYLAYCIAKERGKRREAIELCKEAINDDPEDPLLYLNLARVYILTGEKKNALNVLRQAAKQGGDEVVMRLIKKLGIRKEPVLPFLSRDNPLNILLGKLRHKFLG